MPAPRVTPTRAACAFDVHLPHRCGNSRSARHRRTPALHYVDARSRWLNDLAATNPFLLVRGREYPGGL